MRNRIFDTDPEQQAKQAADDLVGRFRSGAQINSRPVSLDAWRVTSGDPEVIAAVANLFGGEPDEWDPGEKSEEDQEVYTEAASVEIILAGPSAVTSGMVLWGRKGKLRECDGVTQKDGSACVCPQKLSDRKEEAKAGTGCEPSTMIFFRLADAPDLGRFRFISGSWSIAGEIGKAQDALDEIGGPARATLTLEKVEYTTKAGREVSFTKPVLKVTGPAEEGDEPIYGDEEPF